MPPGGRKTGKVFIGRRVGPEVSGRVFSHAYDLSSVDQEISVQLLKGHIPGID